MLGEQALVVDRPGTLVLVAGEWTAPNAEVLNIRGTLLPINERTAYQLQRLPEGWRVHARFVLYSRTELRSVDVQGAAGADRVRWEGKGLLVATVNDYADGAPGMGLQHYRYVLLAEEVTP